MFKKKPWRINTYWGYGTATCFRATGRALKKENINFEGNTGTFKTLWNIFKQFESDELRNKEIQIKLSNGQVFTTHTNSEGYYFFEEPIVLENKLTETTDWLPYIVSFHTKQIENSIADRNIFKGKMLIPSPKADFGIISDIDDTILHTGVASLFKWRLIANTFFKNFDRRMPLEGTVDLYKKFQIGTQDKPINPVFYVSNSPWNLYDYLTAFLNRHQFPKGPILLRDFRMPFDKTPKRKIPHKQEEIENIIQLYPDLKFILIGDSGEKDADYYINVAKKFQNRILAIYLQNVNHKRRERRIKRLIETFTDVPAILVKTAQEAEDHAKKIGLIKKN